MTVGVAGVGYVAVDLRPTIVERPHIFEGPPGWHAEPSDYKKVGVVAGVILSDEEWESYDTEFEAYYLSGVIYGGAINGWVGLARKRTTRGGTLDLSAPGSGLAHRRAARQLVEYVLEHFAWEKEIDSDTEAWAQLSVEDEAFNVAAVMSRTRRIDPDDVQTFSQMVAAGSVADVVIPWGRIWAESAIHQPITDGYKPVGMVCVGAGSRFWAIGGASSYRSTGPHKIAHSRPDIDDGFKKVVCSRQVRRYRVWEKVWIVEEFKGCGA